MGSRTKLWQRQERAGPLSPDGPLSPALICLLLCCHGFDLRQVNY